MDTTHSLLVLDVDETLVYGVEEPLPGRQPDFKTVKYHVYKRPHVAEFLTRSAKLYTPAVWSSGGEDYVHLVCNNIFPSDVRPAFIWTLKDCLERRGGEVHDTWYIKDLVKVRKLGFKLERTLLVEDTPANGMRQYGNVIRVQRYEGQEDDDELLMLVRYLEQLHAEPNFRKVEKRGWRSRVRT